MRKKAIVLAVVALIAVGIAGASIHSKSQTAMAGFSDRLEAELSTALGGKVTVGSLEIKSINRIAITDVTVSDGIGQPLLTGEAVSVVFNPLALLGGGAAINAVRELVVERPQVYLTRQADGRWNIDDLLERTRSDESAFAGKITMEKGLVAVKTPEGQWRLEDIDGSFDFAGKPEVTVKLTATYEGAPLDVTGRVNKQGPSLLALSATNLPLEGLKTLVPQQFVAKPLTGRLGKLNVIVRRDKGETVFAGEAELAGVDIDIAGLPVRETRGSVAFSDKQLFFFPLSAKVYGQNIVVRGKIATDQVEPVLGLTVSADSFDAAAIDPALPVRGPLAFMVTVGGTPSRPVASGEVRLPSGEVEGYKITGAVAKFSLVESALTVKELQAAALGGQLSGSGTVLVDKKQYSMQISGRDIDLAALPALGIGVTGRGDVDCKIEGAQTLAAAKIAGTATFRSGLLANIPYAGLSVGFFRDGQRLTVDYLTLDFAPGLLTAKGSVDAGRLNLSFFAQGMPLSVLAAEAGGFDLAGTADGEGQVSGTVDEPLVAARFTAYNGQALYQPFALARGSLMVTPATVTLHDIEATYGGASHRINGSIGLTGNRELNITLTTRKARAENLVKLIMPGERLTGNVDNEVNITGPLANFTAAGKIKLTEGSFRGQLIAKAEGSYRRQGRLTELKDFVIDSLNAQVRLNGKIAADNQLELAITARDIELSTLQVNFPYPVSGQANFDGNLTGTLENPVFNGAIAAKSIKLNGQELSEIGGQISATSERLDVPVFAFSQGVGKFSFAGGISFKPGTIYGSLSAENGSVASLLAILNVPTKGIEGRLDGQVQVGGTVTKPNIWLTGTMSNGKIKNYPLESIEVDISLENNVVTFNRFYAKQGSGMLAVRGTAAIDGPLNLEIGGRSLDAGLLTAWLDTTVDPKGKLTFTAQVSGTAYSPYAAVSLEIDGGGVANATFAKLYGLFVLDKGSIEVNQLLLTKGPYRASAYGKVPLAALNKEGRARATIADQMDLKVRLEQANLSILPLITKEVAWASGETKGEVTLGGTLAQPLIYGSLSVVDGTVKLAALAEPVQKVGVDIQFEGDKINIKTFDGRMGSGSYRLTGTAAVNGLALADYRILLVLDNLAVNNKYFKGPLNGTLTLNSTDTGRPLLAGQLVFENTTANIPYIPEFSPTGLDVGLDLEVVAGKKVHLSNPYFYDLWIEGKAKFSGTTRAPVASGRFATVRGTVYYLHTAFQVESATADFVQYGSLLPVIRMSANTKLETTKVNLAVNGPLNAMDIRLSSEPGMNQQEILSLLTLRSRYHDKQAGGNQSGFGREELLTLLDAGLQMRFMVEAESTFRNAFGVDEFRLVRSTLSGDSANSSGSTSGTTSTNGKSATVGDREVYNVEIGKYVTDRLFLSYTLGLDHKETSAYMRYDLSPRLSLNWAVDEYYKRRIGFEARFNF
jgi:translocation and assembly module TamB